MGEGWERGGRGGRGVEGTYISWMGSSLTEEAGRESSPSTEFTNDLRVAMSVTKSKNRRVGEDRGEDIGRG